MKLLKINTYHHEDDYSTEFINVEDMKMLSFYKGCDHMRFETASSRTEGIVKNFSMQQFEDFIKCDNKKIFLIEFINFTHSEGSPLFEFREEISDLIRHGKFLEEKETWGVIPEREVVEECETNVWSECME